MPMRTVSAPLLQRCTSLWGTAEIHDHEPAIQKLENTYYLPYVYGIAWGIIDAQGHPVSETIDFREGRHFPSDQNFDHPTHIDKVSEWAPDAEYIYGGRINGHFGHFLVNTLPRFWLAAQQRPRHVKILCHKSWLPDGWFQTSFFATVFEALGFSADDFVIFDRPMRVRNLIIPSTSLEEQRAGYRTYGRMCRIAGDRIRAAGSVSFGDRPIYYSKTRLKNGVGRIVNEDEIEAVMRKAGVEIVYPETMSLTEQVCLMSSRKHILGTAGSFLHASLFCPERSITCLNVTEDINTNYTLIDELSYTRSGYFFPPSIEVLDSYPDFITARHLPDAAAVAVELLDRMPSGS